MNSNAVFITVSFSCDLVVMRSCLSHMIGHCLSIYPACLERAEQTENIQRRGYRLF